MQERATVSTLDRIRAKVTRAKQHLREFEIAIKAFGDTNPPTISTKEDAQAGKRIYYISRVDCIPDDLTAIAADVIQNARGALDHIVYQLVLNAPWWHTAV